MTNLTTPKPAVIETKLAGKRGRAFLAARRVDDGPWALELNALQRDFSPEEAAALAEDIQAFVRLIGALNERPKAGSTNLGHSSAAATADAYADLFDDGAGAPN
jgi:hypothetical protein